MLYRKVQLIGFIGRGHLMYIQASFSSIGIPPTRGGLDTQVARCVLGWVVEDIEQVWQVCTGRRNGEGRREGDRADRGICAVDYILGLGAKDCGCVEKVKVVI